MREKKLSLHLQQDVVDSVAADVNHHLASHSHESVQRPQGGALHCHTAERGGWGEHFILQQSRHDGGLS